MGYKNPDKQRAYQRQWTTQRREEWICNNGPCAVCESWEQLEVDHKDRATKNLNPSYLWSLAKTNPTRIAELEKCQVLCRACHKEKTIQELSLTCDSRQGAKKGCKCTPCRRKNAARVRLWRERV